MRTVNEEWISDKGTFLPIDGLEAPAAWTRPYLRVNGKLEPISWEEAFVAIKQQLRSKDTLPERIAAIAGDLVRSAEIMSRR